MGQKPSAGVLALQAAGAAGWAILFSVAPVIEVLILGSLLWIPLLVWCEVRRTKQYGFLAGFVARVAVAAAILTAAVLAPVKWEDQNRIDRLSGMAVTLAELKSSRFHFPENRKAQRVTFPANPPTFRQAMRSVEDQTGMRCAPARCGNSASILRGGAIIYVRVEEPEATAR